MKRFVCTVCGYVYEGEAAPEECPVCHQPASKFKEEPLENEKPEGESGEPAVKEEQVATDLSYDKSFLSY